MALEQGRGDGGEGDRTGRLARISGRNSALKGGGKWDLGSSWRRGKSGKRGWRDRVLGETGKRTGPGRTGRALGGEKGAGMGLDGTGWVLGGGRGLGWGLAGQERWGDGLHDKAGGRAGGWSWHNGEIVA